MMHCEVTSVPKAQKEILINAYRSGKGCTINLPLKKGNNKLAVTESLHNKIIKAVNNNEKNIELKMPLKLVEANAEMKGGFLGSLLGIATRALPMILKTIIPSVAMGALSGAASAGVEKAIKGKGDLKSIISGKNLYLKKGGCFLLG